MDVLLTGTLCISICGDLQGLSSPQSITCHRWPSKMLRLLDQNLRLLKVIAVDQGLEQYVLLLGPGPTLVTAR